MKLHNVSGLRNLGNTCFLNALLQALASAEAVLKQLQGCAGPVEGSIPILAKCLGQLLPINVERRGSPVSPSPVLDAFRRDRSGDPSCILDGEENDACEALYLLVSIISDELQRHFRTHQCEALCSQAAINAILSLSQGCKTSETAGIAHSLNPRQEATPAPRRAECHSHTQGYKAQSSRLTLQPRSETEGPAAVKGAAAVQTAGTSAAHPLIVRPPRNSDNIIHSSQAQEAAHEDGAVHASKEAPPAHVRVHAAEQAEPVLAAWRACKSPLELSQAQEVACLVCRRLTSTTMSTAVALPLVLPAVKGMLGNQAKPGMSLDDLLRSHFAAHAIQDAVCTWCSMKWTLLEHHRSTDRTPQPQMHQPDSNGTLPKRAALHPGSTPAIHRAASYEPAAHDAAAHQPPELPCAECARSPAPEQASQPAAAACSAAAQLLNGHRQGLGPLPEANADATAAAPCQQRASRRAPARQPELAAGAGSADAWLLEGCLRGACPLPEADVQSMAERAGMRWVQRRGTLLARTLIAQAPQVLCLQLQRVRWSSIGSPEKLHGHVAFPLRLDLSPYRAAAAQPLLGKRTLADPVGKEGGLNPTHQDAALPLKQLLGQTPDSANLHDCRDEAQRDHRKRSCRTHPSGCAYRLVAVIVHHGSPRSGHYTTYRNLHRNLHRMSDSNSDEQWVCVSDENVRHAHLREVLNCQASILFYEKPHM